jgi:demethylmenaquinone methyltransferase/2-methoxy-6-polyprenyl-1,4-benzoquinol methylase
VKNEIQKIFSEVSGSYELVNHLLTFGLDIFWRRKASREASGAGGDFWLDVCSGTGEFARNLQARVRRKTKVVIVDFCPAMLEQARRKEGLKKSLLAAGEASNLPFPDARFDLVTISFATRNINLSREALARTFQEFGRVLKPGGRLVNLETSRPRNGFIKKLFMAYVRIVVKPVGYLLSGSRAGYAYLSSTIPRFYGPQELADILTESRFYQVTWRPLSFGLVAVHIAVKKARIVAPGQLM